jgi:hypothetical protein
LIYLAASVPRRPEIPGHENITRLLFLIEKNLYKRRELPAQRARTRHTNFFDWATSPEIDLLGCQRSTSPRNPRPRKYHAAPLPHRKKTLSVLFLSPEETAGVANPPGGRRTGGSLPLRSPRSFLFPSSLSLLVSPDTDTAAASTGLHGGRPSVRHTFTMHYKLKL